MSAPVDVLAVLDEVITGIVKNPVRERRGNRESLIDVRAAVAELIAAAHMANGDHSAPDDCYATGPLTGNAYRDLIVCPGCRLAGALARVGGAK